MYRIVDLPRAIEARPALAAASGHGVTVGISDAAAPWNAGSWRIECREGRMTAERTPEAPEAELDIAALAALYNGYLRPAEAERAGAVRALAPHAIDELADLFSVAFAPYCPDDF
jgi:predicted acetyltransferase